MVSPLLKTGSRLIPKAAFSAATILKIMLRYWYIVVFLIFIIPPTFDAIKLGIETKNPTLPFFVLAEHIFAADATLGQMVNDLRQNPATLIGTEKPIGGIWKNTVYYWNLWWNVIFVMLGLVYLIFVPLIIIYKFVRQRNISETAKNLYLAILWFILYLFVVNAVIIMQRIITGTITIELEAGMDNFQQYLVIFINLLPFHGLVNLVVYLIQLMG